MIKKFTELLFERLTGFAGQSYKPCRALSPECCTTFYVYFFHIVFESTLKSPFSPPKHEGTKYHKNYLIDFHYFVRFSILVILWHFILFDFSEWTRVLDFHSLLYIVIDNSMLNNFAICTIFYFLRLYVPIFPLHIY